MTHCDYVLIFSPSVLLAYDLCPQHFLSVGQLLSDCTSPQQCSVNDKSTLPNMQSTHTHILLFGSKFHTILAMYMQMVNIYMYQKIENVQKKSRYFPILAITFHQTCGYPRCYSASPSLGQYQITLLRNSHTGMSNLPKTIAQPCRTAQMTVRSWVSW